MRITCFLLLSGLLFINCTQQKAPSADTSVDSVTTEPSAELRIQEEADSSQQEFILRW